MPPWNRYVRWSCSATIGSCSRVRPPANSVLSGNSFEVVKGMRFVPFTVQTVLQLAVTTLLPVVPLMLTMISLEQLLERLLKIVF